MKTNIIIAIFCILGALFCWWRINYLEEQLTLSIAKNDELNATLEKAREANVQANIQIKKLRELKATDNETADWYNSRLPDSVLMLLQERYGKHN